VSWKRINTRRRRKKQKRKIRRRRQGRRGKKEEEEEERWVQIYVLCGGTKMAVRVENQNS
jgi:hypothetical protein